MSMSGLAFPASALAIHNLPLFIILKFPIPARLFPVDILMCFQGSVSPTIHISIVFNPALTLIMCSQSLSQRAIFCNVVIHKESWICENAKGDKV